MKKQYKWLLWIGLSCQLNQACAIYSFSGVSLSKKIKTFTIQNIYVDVAKGPNNIDHLLIERLEEQIQKKTTLSKTENEGDIELEGKITAFDYITDHEKSTLSITVVMDYTNKLNKQVSFYNKKFTESSPVASDLDEASEIKETKKMIEKIVERILGDSIINW